MTIPLMTPGNDVSTAKKVLVPATLLPRSAFPALADFSIPASAFAPIAKCAMSQSQLIGSMRTVTPSPFSVHVPDSSVHSLSSNLT